MHPPARAELIVANGSRRIPGAAILNLAMLYISKLGAIVVGLLILPQFNRLLGPEQFGAVAVILSVQALLLTLDLGTSTLVGRDVAAHAERSGVAAGTWVAGKDLLTAAYLAITPLVCLCTLAFRGPLSLVDVIACVVLCWALTLQNLGQTALLAARRFAAAGVLQLGGVTSRALLTLWVLQVFEPTLSNFVLAQAACAVLHWVATRLACKQLFGIPAEATGGLRGRAARALHMARRGAPLALFGLAGAAVMQLDKPIVSALASAADTAPYYLATVLCLAPLSTLAGPVAQFYQPRLIRALTGTDDQAVRTCLKSFTTVLVLITFLPSALLWLLREPIATAWLGTAGPHAQVAHYAAILLPGVAVGALGYLPYSILVARQDFRFQAAASTGMTILTLAAAAWMAHRGRVDGVCWVYAGYHCLSTLVSWLRCIQLDRGGPAHASAAGLRTAAWAAAVCLPSLGAALTFQFT